jgi:nitroreductase
MTLLDLLRKRRSIRRYSDRPIPPETVDMLAEAVLRSPSSRGINPWRFIFVDDRETLTRLSNCKPHGAAFLAGAALGVVICGDERESDAWIEDCSIASTVLQLTAEDLGLGSCWVQVRMRNHGDGGSAEDAVRRELGLSSEQRVESIIAIGYPAESMPGHAHSELPWQKVHRSGFQTDPKE